MKTSNKNTQAASGDILLSVSKKRNKSGMVTKSINSDLELDTQEKVVILRKFDKQRLVQRYEPSTYTKDMVTDYIVT